MLERLVLLQLLWLAQWLAAILQIVPQLAVVAAAAPVAVAVVNEEDQPDLIDILAADYDGDIFAAVAVFVGTVAVGEPKLAVAASTVPMVASMLHQQTKEEAQFLVWLLYHHLAFQKTQNCADSCG